MRGYGQKADAVLQINNHMNQSTGPNIRPHLAQPSLIRSLSLRFIMSPNDDKQRAIPHDFQIPDGFAVGECGPDRIPAVVPFFLMPTLDHMLRVQAAHQHPAVQNASAMVSAITLSY